MPFRGLLEGFLGWVEPVSMEKVMGGASVYGVGASVYGVGASVYGVGASVYGVKSQCLW